MLTKMRSYYSFTSVLAVCFACSISLKAQTSFDRVKTIFDNHCTTGCHSGASPDGQLDLTGSVADVYAELVGNDPVNPAAVSAGMKLVDAGYPDRSFLFAKVSADIDPIDHLVQAMGTAMPQNSSHLPYEDIEMLRQWILFGADTVSDYVDPQLLSDYYNGTTGMARLEPPVAPDPSEGIQIHYGPFFLGPLEEREFFYKYETKEPEALEVNRVNIVINEFAHHTALYRYYPYADTNFAPGLRPVNSIIDAAGVYYSSDIIGQWPNSQDVVLPQGAAFFWNDSVVLDLNYHLPNYSSDSILAGEFYMNIYTQPSGTAQQEMKSYPVYYGGNDPGSLVIPPNTVDSVYTIDQHEAGAGHTWYIWSIMAHTHQTGQDYQVWMRNPDGTKGENIYNGHYDATYTFDQGHYDWQHPPFRTFDEELLEVDFANGLIHEATFTNPSSTDTIWFGLTTEDEMYVTYIQYVEQPLTGIEEVNGVTPDPLVIYPNPSNGTINLTFDVAERDQFQVMLLNEMGQEVYRSSANYSVGRQRISIDMQSLALAEGLYFVKLSSSGQQLSSKVVLY